MDNGRSRLWRSRWAAIGAAVAVTLGAGGLYTGFAASAPSNFVAISPVRVLDTRLAGFGPALAAGAARQLDVTGTISTVATDGETIIPGSVVPDGATAIVANVTAVAPTSAGFLSVRPGTATGNPTTSSVNFTAAGVVVPNSVTVEVPPSGEIQIVFGGSAGATTHVLVDVVGYYATAGAGFTPWGTIPSGQTVRGNAFYNGHTPPVPDDNALFVPLPARAPVALTLSTVNFASVGAVDTDPSCTGTVENPTAPPGKVCIYYQFSSGILPGTLQGAAADPLTDSGFRVAWTSAGTGGAQELLRASWAYTAP